MQKILILLVLILSQVSSSDFKDATTAYKNKEYKKAVSIFKKLCNENNVKACIKIGNAYQYGDMNTITKNPKNASKYHKKIVAIYKHLCTDKKDSQSCNKLGDMYTYGYYTKKNSLMAKKYRKKQLTYMMYPVKRET